MNKQALISNIVFCLCIAMVSCGGGDDDDLTSTGTGTEAGTGTGEGTTGSETQIMLKTVERPTDWVRVGSGSDYNPGVSVSFVIAQPVFTKYASPSIAEDSGGDMMAVFVNGTCRGVSGLFGNGNVFMLSTVSLDNIDDPNANKLVTIRYYSAKLHHVFTAQATYYMKNGTESYGTRTAPLMLEWQPDE